jgi:hypothetical protein
MTLNSMANVVVLIFASQKKRRSEEGNGAFFFGDVAVRLRANQSAGRRFMLLRTLLSIGGIGLKCFVSQKN